MNFNKLDVSISHILPNGFLKDTYTRGMRRLAEYGLFTQTYVTETRYGFLMTVDRLDVVKWYVHYFGHIEPQISKAWSNLLKPGDKVIDIGANVGYYSLLAGKCVGKDGKVLAFEPSSHIYEQLKENIALNLNVNIDAKKYAVSNNVGTVDFYYAGDNSQGNSSIMASHGGKKMETVSTVSFDEIANMIALNEVKLIKIDVEGAEGLVLNGLERHIDELNLECVIFLEVSPENIETAHIMLEPFLRKGFHIKQIANEYTTEFYTRPVKVELNDWNLESRQIQDLILCRNPKQFEILIGALH
jgi:FkbM family methyltransferase